MDLMELRFIGELLKFGYKMRKIRDFKRDVQSRLEGLDHPFARSRFYSDGTRLFLESEGQTEELGTGGQLAIGKVIRQVGKELRFNDATGLPGQWWPLTQKRHVVLDPEHGFGAPTIAGRNLKTSNVYELYLAEGRRTRLVADWFGITERDVRDAVAFEVSLRPAA
jgi:uncharacterized protein (DUF433 family)